MSPADLESFYLGGTVAYVAGDDPRNPGKNKRRPPERRNGLESHLILFNNERTYWAGAIYPAIGFRSTY